MSEILRSMIDRDELHYVQLFEFRNEETARYVYLAMLNNEVPIPLKSAVALIRDGCGYSILMFIGTGFRVPELPKPLDHTWSWYDYFRSVGLPPQDDWKEWPSKRFPGFERLLGSAMVVEFFLSEGLKSQSYRCLACGESFDSYGKLFDEHVYSIVGHDQAFNASVLARVPQEQVASGASPEEALQAGRALLPAGAEIQSEEAVPGNTKRVCATGSGSTADEATERARKCFARGEIVTDREIIRQGTIRSLEMNLDLSRANNEAQVGNLIREQVRSQFDDVPWEDISIRKYECVQKGSSGFLGIGRKPRTYYVEVQVMWRVKQFADLVTPATARIRYRAASAAKPAAPPGQRMTEEATRRLLEAVDNGDVDAAIAAVKDGADVNAKQSLGFTALMTAASRGKPTDIEFLLSHGANANARNNVGATALMSAALDGKADIVQALVTGGADVDAVNNSGETALMMVKGSAAVARVLIDARANVGLKSQYGSTALMQAARSGKEDAVRLLLYAGADPHARDEKGETARQWAQTLGHAAIVDLLAQAERSG
ncbi:MAG: ankyrin repeat domain-containing protein [Acidobacteriota bacterium]